MFCLYEPNEILQVSRPCKVQLFPVSAARPVQSEAGISHNLHLVITTDLTQADWPLHPPCDLLSSQSELSPRRPAGWSALPPPPKCSPRPCSESTSWCRTWRKLKHQELQPQTGSCQQQVSSRVWMKILIKLEVFSHFVLPRIPILWKWLLV